MSSLIIGLLYILPLFQIKCLPAKLNFEWQAAKTAWCDVPIKAAKLLLMTFAYRSTFWF
jgi:hypothetical protein